MAKSRNRLKLPLLWLVIIIVVAWIVDQSESFQHCIHHSDDNASHDASPEGIANILDVLRLYRACTGGFISDNHDAITALATLFIALFTLTLWISTRQLWRAGEIHSERELRAYVAVTPAQIGDINPNLRISCAIMFMNAGRTPARKARQAAIIRIEQHPLPAKFQFPDLTHVPETSRFSILPGLPTNGGVIADSSFSQAQIEEFLQAPVQGGRRLYMFGQIDFVDIFDEPRWVRFCVSFAGNHDWVPLAAAGNWAAIKAAATQAGVGFT